MEFNDIFEIINFAPPLFFLYTELHYRFPFIPSRYFIKEPEILSDVPHRIEPGQDIPFFILIKDGDEFPIDLEKISISIYNDEQSLLKESVSIQETINDHFWSRTISIPTSNLKGVVLADIQFDYKMNDKILSCKNHNIKSLKFQPFKINVSEHPLPGCDQVQWGDLHYHSNLTEDMVEFGAPLKETLSACKAIGLDFICNTDHSYDLDDMEGSWTETDPDLKKWKNSRKEIKNLNEEFDFSPFMIPSEELTMHNSIGRNVHALILNNDTFLPGRGDGAENGLDFHSEHNSDTVYSELEEKALCIAAHPFVSVPVMQWLFFKRGVWEDYDVLQDRMSGLQILNGEIDQDFVRGVKEWVHYLLKGHRKFIYAGNDAHGNFNIFRQIKIPMLKIEQADKQILGQCRTGVYPDKLNSIESTIEALRVGNCFITNGPYLNFHLNGTIKMGRELKAELAQLQASVLSSPEFGKILGIRVIQGIIGEKKETILYEIVNSNSAYEMEISESIPVNKKSYFRVETESEISGKKHLAMSNPIWVNPSE